MALGKQWVKFEFGATQQERDGKYLRTGELIEAVNVEQVPDGGPHVKRPGFDKTNLTYPDATFTGSPEALLPGDGTSILLRDSAGRAYAMAAPSTFYDRGKLDRFMPEPEVALPVQLATPRPVMAFTTTQQWIFGVDVAGGAYYYTVKDLQGNIVQAQTRIAATGILQLAAAYDPNNAQVWVIWVAGGTTATSHKFTVSTPGVAPTSATYQTIASATLQGVDMRYLSVPNEIAVVVSGLDGSGGGSVARWSHSYLDLSTGAAKVSPAAVTTTQAPSGVYMCSSPHILFQDGTGGAWHYAIWTHTATLNTVRLHLFNITSSTLAVAADTTIVDVVGTATFRRLGVVSGYVESATGDRVLYAQEVHLPGSTWTWTNPVINKYRWNGSSVTTSNAWMRGSWLATTWDTRSSNYYCLIGHDDGTDNYGNSTGPGVDRVLFLVDQDANILARIGSGPAVLTRNASSFPTSSNTTMAEARVSTFVHYNNIFYFTTGLTTTALNALSAGVVRFDIAGMTYSQSQPFGEKAIAAGGIPIVWSKGDKLHEMGPLVYPSFIDPNGAAGTANAACYRITDSDGTVWRSAPVLLASGAGAGQPVTVPTLRHTLPYTVVEIEIYAGSGTPQLQGYVANDKTVDSVNFTLPSPLRTDETLYTTGGALSNAPMFPSRAVYTWRNRMFCAEGNNIRYSQEFSAGLGPQFNEILATVFYEGSGDVLAFGAVDWNYLAVFKRDAIAVISGTGPDGRGQGNYVVQVLTTKMGVTNLGSIVSGPGGCFFQDSQTGRICCVTPSLQVLEAAPGLDDYAMATTVLTATHVESRRQIWFKGNDANNIMVLDYRHTADASPFGQCYYWSGAGIAGWAMCVDSTGPVIHDFNRIFRLGTSYLDQGIAYSMKLTTSDLFEAAKQGEFAVSRVQFLGTWRASHDVRITTYPDFATTGTTAMKTMNAGPEQVVTRPPNCGRIQSLRVTIEEMNSTGRGFDFHGLAIEIQPRGRAKTLNTNQVI